MKKEKTMHAKRGESGSDGRVILRQYRLIAKEIVDDRRRLSQLSRLYSPSFFKGASPCDLSDNPAGLPIGIPPIDELRRYHSLIEQNYTRCAQLLGDMQEYINSIDDSETRRIFTMHYINGWTWQKIAFNINSYDESYPRKKHERYLKKHPFQSRAALETDAGGQ